MSRHARIQLPLVVGAALATAAAIVACGGSPAPSSNTSAGGQNTANPEVRFASCMRSHGVSNFPNPEVHQAANITLPPGEKGSPAFKSANRKCRSYLIPVAGARPLTASEVRKRTQAALAFARCMRDRGFPNFPDPTVQGQLTPEMVTAAGINLHQPAVLQAGLACTSVTHGLLTRRDVERAVNGG